MEYNVVLTNEAARKKDIIIYANVDGTGCTLTPEKVINGGKFTLSTVVDRLDLRLDALSYSCKVTHTVATDDLNYKNARPLQYSIGVLSKGCGNGEYLLSLIHI